MATYDDLPVDVRVLRPGDLVDLVGRDQNPANAGIWEFEYAVVESVSTHDNLSGGWLDPLVKEGTAVIYVQNGAGSAIVLDQPDRKGRHPRSATSGCTCSACRRSA